jgi:hypothetical protein
MHVTSIHTDSASADIAAWWARGSGGPPEERSTKNVVGSFGMQFVPLKEGFILRDLGVTSIANRAGPPIIAGGCKPEHCLRQ